MPNGGLSGLNPGIFNGILTMNCGNIYKKGTTFDTNGHSGGQCCDCVNSKIPIRSKGQKLYPFRIATVFYKNTNDWLIQAEPRDSFLAFLKKGIGRHTIESWCVIRGYSAQCINFYHTLSCSVLSAATLVVTL